jgi:hypothetical protein
MQINFNCPDIAIHELCTPKPTIDCIPHWFSSMVEIPIGIKDDRNIKSCLPVQDFLTSGYILFNSYQLNLEEKFIQFNKTLNVETTRPEQFKKTLTSFQKQQCPVPHVDKPDTFFKINLDWTITTPPGYSCLIMQPYYLFENRYTIMPAIVDTDKLDIPISVAGFVTTKSLVEIKPGDPFVQVIPFKRDDWNMSVGHVSKLSKIKHYVFDGYKSLFHSPKRFK